tara:strand:- start:23 stop:193 length:171 start_codon:yes stop_codon:yes gene_type:complete
LCDQAKYFAAVTPAMIHERLAATGRIYRYSTKQIPELGCAVAIEAAVSAPGESCDV